jgi:carboxypeptidase family protein
MPSLSAGPSRRRPAILLALGALLVAAVPPLQAQVADAVVEVAVVDESSQVIPGVTVTVIRPDTGFQQVTTTDGSGTARVIALPPGTYDVKLELAGFATIDQKGITLRVGQTARVSVTMTVAKVAETVNVTAEVPLVDVFKTDSSTNIVPEQIQELPVVDRDFQRLAFLAPGVQRERGAYRFITNQPVIGAGGNASQATILVDGVDFTDPTLGLARARFSQDAIGEFRVIANRFDTEVGGSAGGALSIVTKSGTNQLRGSAFGFFRDDALRSKSKFELQKNNYSRQQFGATLGGPIVKDRTHFFLSFEQINEDAISLFRPGGIYANRAKDVTVPTDQPLVYLGVDDRVNNDQNLRMKFVYEHVKQENFRVGGFADETSGIELTRDNWNFTATHSWTLGNSSLNQMSVQAGHRQFDEPNNSTALSEYFTLGNTLITGANITGDQVDKGNVIELRDTLFKRIGSGSWAQDIKIGGAWQYVSDHWNFPVYPQGLMFYANDTRTLPVIYAYGTGSADTVIKTHLISGFLQDDFRPSSRVTVSLGVRYDLDTNGNNPDFTSPLMPNPRGRDTNNLQPRFGFTWDVLGDGSNVVRGGAGVFTGRFLLVPAFVEQQQNGFSGRIVRQRWSSLLFGNLSALLNPASPTTTGIALAPDAGRLSDSFVNPRATQVTAGYTVRLGTTGLFADFEGIYVKGTDEIIIRDINFCGNATGRYGCRVNTSFGQINAYTNDGYSRYVAFVASLNGTLRGGHVITASFTAAEKKNINDDFSPALTDYPNDPADIRAEWGRSRGDERYRFVASGVFRLPYDLTVAPIFEYGSGQPWNRRRGYDYNGDGKTSDRLPGVRRFDQDGPNFLQTNLRLTYKVPFRGRSGVDLIAEVFNLFDRVNYDVNSLINAQYLSGPTMAAPAAALVPNPRYGQYTATLSPREFQLGARITF